MSTLTSSRSILQSKEAHPSNKLYHKLPKKPLPKRYNSKILIIKRKRNQLNSPKKKKQSPHLRFPNLKPTRFKLPLKLKARKLPLELVALEQKQEFQ